jgi:hypothetical protein
MAMKTDETAVANPVPSLHVNGMPLMGISMALQDVGSHDMAMKTDETAVTNTAPSNNHVNGMPQMGISMALHDVGSHDMTSRISSDRGFKLSIEKDMAINMEVVNAVAVRSLTHNQSIADGSIMIGSWRECG